MYDITTWSMWRRFSPSCRKSLKAYVLQLVNEQLGRHNLPADNVSRNLLKFLITSVGFPELRLLVAQKIDSWIQNPKVLTCSCMILRLSHPRDYMYPSITKTHQIQVLISLLKCKYPLEYKYPSSIGTQGGNFSI